MDLRWDNSAMGYLAILGLICFMILLAIFVYTILPKTDGLEHAPAPEDISGYTIFYIEGMPCVWIERSENADFGSTTRHAGLSCDWSRWDGE